MVGLILVDTAPVHLRGPGPKSTLLPCCATRPSDHEEEGFSRREEEGIVAVGCKQKAKRRVLRVSDENCFIGAILQKKE